MLLLRNSLLAMRKKKFLCHYLYSCGGFACFLDCFSQSTHEHCACCILSKNGGSVALSSFDLQDSAIYALFGTGQEDGGGRPSRAIVSGWEGEVVVAP